MTAPLDPRLVFDRFVVGPANRMAAAAARRAAEQPGVSYNPLVICGPPGLGKTHLLTAIGHLAREVEPGLYLHYETMGSFVDRLSESLAAGTLDDLRAATGGMRLLLLDDLQDATGKARTQYELLRLWQGMIHAGAQVVVAADRPPHEIPGLDARFVSRLAAGLIVEIGAPEPETRRGILAHLSRERGTSLPDDVLDALAALPGENAHELRAALDRVAAVVETSGRPITAAEVPALLGPQRGGERRGGDEFDAFLSDISSVVAAVVETEPWRRRIARAILRWEGEGIRTRRLEEALDADAAPDVDALLAGFARDVSRLREIRRELRGAGVDPALFEDPDRLPEAQTLLDARVPASPAPRPPRPPADPSAVVVDRWFLDREKLALDWLALDDRLQEERA